MKIALYTKFIGPEIDADMLPNLPEIGEVKTYRDGSADNFNVETSGGQVLPPIKSINRHLDWLLEHQPAIYTAGAEKTVIYYTYWSNSQGNTEFSAIQIRKFAKLGAALAITCATSRDV